MLGWKDVLCCLTDPSADSGLALGILTSPVELSLDGLPAPAPALEESGCNSPAMAFFRSLFLWYILLSFAFSVLVGARALQ